MDDLLNEEKEQTSTDLDISIFKDEYGINIIFEGTDNDFEEIIRICEN